MTQRKSWNGRIRGTVPNIDSQARYLRQRMTPAERALWAALRNRRLDGLKFRRQHPLGPFIVDLCCPDRLLIVEIDGNIHDQQFDYDEERSRLLEEFGYEVIRFRNEDIIHHLGNVLREISSVAANRVAASQQRPRE